MNTRKTQELEGELVTLENDVLPDLKKTLAWLTRPDYSAEEDSDHEYRDQDIESLESEIANVEGQIAKIKKRLEAK